MHRCISLLAKLLPILLLSTVWVSAQTFRGSINGIISDQSGAVLPNVPVTATATTTGIIHTTATSSAGEFLFQDLPIGEYVVEANSSGFQGEKIDRVPVSSGAVYTLKIVLHPAQTMTSVEVSAGPGRTGHRLLDGAHRFTDNGRTGPAAKRPRCLAAGGPVSRFCRRPRPGWGRPWIGEWNSAECDQLADRRHR